MRHCLTNYLSKRKAEKKVEEDYIYWLPIIAGIATREEVEMATAEELSILQEVSIQKIKLTRGGV